MAKKLLRTLYANGYTNLNKITILGVIDGKLHIVDENKDHYHLSLTASHKPIKLNDEEIIEDIVKIDEEVLNQLDPEEREEVENIVKNVVKPIGHLPRGWALRSVFIDEGGNVFYKGIHQSNLRGQILENGTYVTEQI